MIKIKINNKSYDYPTSWGDLTFRQYLYVIEGHNVHEHIANFTGIDLETLHKANITGADILFGALAFMNSKVEYPAYISQIGPYKLPINHKGVFDPRFESLGQFEDMRNAMFGVKKDDVYDLTKTYAKYIAIYLQKLKDGEYNYERIDVEEVMNFPALDVLSLGSFFLIRLLYSLTGTPVTSPKRTSNRKKSKQGLSGSRKSSAPTDRSRTSRKK